MVDHIKVIAFDADDTLWVNEPYFQEVEQQFCSLLEDYLPRHTVSQELFKTEMANLPLYGYGIKAFMLCMIETVLRVTENTASPAILHKVIECGQQMLNKPIEMLDGVEDVLKALSGKYRLVVATKGDLLDQERKLKKSGLAHYFHHIEIMSDKKESDYQKLLQHLDCSPENFVMIGNSLKSDILPVLGLGCYAVHIPYHTTWQHEHVDVTIEDPHFYQFNSMADILPHLIS
ncbi:HAD family hydrolase [Chitinophaga polysaccharea]|uniref:HAD family hydrolase n=1 Tax=Chitinophaga TaxID=79328 RepID=UPI00145567C2|nr:MULTISPECIES: HAD family hydrolase [Chitinophaga]NLR62363.1 HAD family hydrolase [Chitinophaga polysaccharea]NLU92464.1 HAD family hydrolase [Chitinophaga sp. Ak27]